MGTESLYQGRFEHENRVAVPDRVVKFHGSAVSPPNKMAPLDDENVGKPGPRTAIDASRTLQDQCLPNSGYATPVFATDNVSVLYRLDGLTGARTVVGPCGIPDVRSLTFDPTTGILYGVTGYPDAGGPLSGLVCTINTATGLATPVGQINGGVCPGSGSVIDGTGQMYGLEGAGCSGGAFHAINKATGVGALVGVIGGSQGQSLVCTAAGQAYFSMGTDIFPIALATGVLGPPVALSSGPIRDMCEVDGQIYGVRIDGSALGTFCTINPTTGLVKLIGPSRNWLGIAAP